MEFSFDKLETANFPNKIWYSRVFSALEPMKLLAWEGGKKCQRRFKSHFHALTPNWFWFSFQESSTKVRNLFYTFEGWNKIPS